MIRDRIERFFKNLLSALGHCIIEDPEAALVILAVGCAGVCWVAGTVVYDLIVDPHLTTAALNSVSIDPDKWFPR